MPLTSEKLWEMKPKYRQSILQVSQAYLINTWSVIDPNSWLKWSDSLGNHFEKFAFLHLTGFLLLRCHSSVRQWPRWHLIACGCWQLWHVQAGASWTGIKTKMEKFCSLHVFNHVGGLFCVGKYFGEGLLVWSTTALSGGVNAATGLCLWPKTLDSQWVAERSSSFKLNFSEAAAKMAIFSGSSPSECLKTLVCKRQSIKT